MFKKTMTLITLITAFIALLFLGFWQLDRLEWKQNIIANIVKSKTMKADASPLDLNKDQDFQRGFIEGNYLKTRPFLIGPRTYEGQSGFHIYQAFRTNKAENIMINRGWIPADSDINISVPFDALKIAGYLKLPDTPNMFNPKNNVDLDLWYQANMEDFEDVLNLDLGDYVLYQETPESSYPQSFEGLPMPRNNHMQYALFWFFMAGLLPVLSIIAYRKKR